MMTGWKKLLAAGLAAALLMSGCGGGGGGTTGGGEKKSDLPVRKKISTPAAASFKINNRDVNIYEYTGLDFKNQALWTESLAASDDTIYFFGMDPKDKEYSTKLCQVKYRDEKLSGFKVLDPRAYWRNQLFISGGDVYYMRPVGKWNSKAKSQNSVWHYYDGKTVQSTALKSAIIPVDQGKTVLYYDKNSWYTGTLDKGKITPKEKITLQKDGMKGSFSPTTLNRWADKDGWYVLGSSQSTNGQSNQMLFQFDAKGRLLRSFEGEGKGKYGFAVTEHFVVLGAKGGVYWIYDKKSGKLLGKGETNPKLFSEVMVPLKNDSVLIYRRLNRSEAKLYRMDL